MGGRGNGGARNSGFSISAESYGISSSEAESIKSFVKSGIEQKYEEDGTSIEANIKPKDRDRLAQSISEAFKNSLGWNVDVSVRRKTEGGTRSRLKNGGMKGKTVYTVISYERRR